MVRVFLPDGAFKTVVVESFHSVDSCLPMIREKFSLTSSQNYEGYELYESLDNGKSLVFFFLYY